MATNNDYIKLQWAIEKSRSEHKSMTDTQSKDLAPTDTQHDNPGVQDIMQDRIKDLTFRSALELPLVQEPQWDTWIFIDPPPRQPEQDEVDYARYIDHYENPMLVKKETLLKHHSPDQNGGFNFEPLFGPSAQFRTIRRRKLTAKLRDQPTVKYVIDLTPPSEGEDAVYLTTELCCSTGVRLWHQASDIWSVSKGLVGGREDYASFKQQKFPPSSPSARFKTSNQPEKHTSVFMPLEYSPVRHRSAIERVVAAQIGFDPKLDSAPKVWSAFAVAKYFCVEKGPIKDYIVRWLRAYPNSFFLEVCPEISLRIADGLETSGLARDSFAILVGEEALDSLFRTRLRTYDGQHSVYGRRKEDLPESLYSRIEYASKSFIERIKSDFEDFAGEDMRWVEDLPAVQKLLSITHVELIETVRALIALLKDYVRGTILKVLYANYDHVPPPDFHHPGGEDLIQRRSRDEVWRTLSLSERILSRTFWQALISFDIFEGETNLDYHNVWGSDDVGRVSERSRELKLGVYLEVRKQDLIQLVIDGKCLSIESSPRPLSNIPDRTRYSFEVNSSKLHTVSDRKFDDPNDDLVPLLEDTPLKESPRRLFDIFPPGQFRDETIVDHQGATQAKAVSWPFGGPHGDYIVHGTDNDEGSTIPRNRSAMVNESREGTHRWPKTSAYSSRFIEAETETTEVDENQPNEPDKSDWPYSPLLLEALQDSNGRQTLPEAFRKLEVHGLALANRDLFNSRVLLQQARLFIKTKARQKLQYADSLERREPHELGITNTLVCLEESEWKYLPLWAGGYDDGSGGVFADQLPTADLGFTTPGPGVHTGTTPANSLSTASEFGTVSDDFETDTVHTSMDNNQSFTGAMNYKRVYSADSLRSSSSDDFDMVSTEAGIVDEDIYKQKEAQDQATREVSGFQKETSTLVDENYADLFDDDGDNESTEGVDDRDSLTTDDMEDEDTVMV